MKVKRRISTSTLLGNWKKITKEHESDIYTNSYWCFWYSHQRIAKGAGELEGWRTSGDHPNYSIIENSQNTEKSPGDLRRLAVTQIPMKSHQLKLMWKTLIMIMIIIIIILWDFNIQTDHLIPSRRPGLIIINKKKRICKIVDFAVPADHRINMKESEKKDK